MLVVGWGVMWYCIEIVRLHLGNGCYLSYCAVNCSASQEVTLYSFVFLDGHGANF